VNLTHFYDSRHRANRDSLPPLALGDAMAAAIVLREDFTSDDLRRLARRTRDGGHARRLLALAEIYDGGARSAAARLGDVGLQTVRDWVLRFNAKGPDGLIDGKAPGQPSKLNNGQRQALAAIIESGPIPAIHGVVRWRLIDPRLREDKPGAMDLGGIPHHHRQADLEPGIARLGLSQAFSTATPPCSSRRCDRGF
jgi:hypothetical protein